MSPRLRHCLPHFVMLLVSIALYRAALQIDTGATAGVERIGPDFWPKAVIVFMGALALFETVRRALFGVAAARAPQAGTMMPDAAVDSKVHDVNAPAQTGAAAAGAEYPRLLLAGIALIVGYVVAVDRLGFFVTTFLFLMCFIRIGGYRRHALNALVSLSGSLLMVLLFMRVAYISLPLGAGPFRDLSIALLNLLGVR